MRVVLATVGTRGDVQPMVAIAVELMRRGHHASLACPASFAPWVRSFGVEHHALGEDLQAKMADASTAPERSIRGMTRYFTEQMALQAPRLMELARGLPRASTRCARRRSPSSSRVSPPSSITAAPARWRSRCAPASRRSCSR